MLIKAQQTVEVEIDDSDLAYAIFDVAMRRCGSPDDAGCDWYTDDRGNTFITDDTGWKVSSDPEVAALIDSYNVLLGNKLLKITESVAA
jgi:hypothetical protein